jgi:hypothetical protein
MELVLQVGIINIKGLFHYGRRLVGPMSPKNRTN